MIVFTFIFILLTHTVKARKLYSVLQLSNNEWCLLRKNGTTPSIADGSVRSDDLFSKIPVFKRIHTIRLMDGVAICSCGYKQRMGIPCRHLFRIEPQYCDRDIHHRWSLAYAAFAYDSNYTKLTSLFEDLQKNEHNGVSLKGDLSRSRFPYLWDDSECTVEEILKMNGEQAPRCFNWDVNEYPTKYRVMFADEEDDTFFSIPCDNYGDLTQESVCTGIAEDFSLHGMEVSGLVAGKGVNDGHLFTQLRTMLPYFQTEDSKGKLLQCLKQLEMDQRREHLKRKEVVDELVGTKTGDDEYVSVHLPIDKSKESHQFKNMYKRSKNK